MLTPPSLKPGDRLLVLSPSGALKEKQALAQGIKIWRSRGYELVINAHHNAQAGYLAGSDQQRRTALQEGWQNSDYQGILCVRGGYGAARLIEAWQWPETSPKWLIGFSDITVLLWSLVQQGIVSCHGPVLTTLAAEPEWSLLRYFDYLEGRSLPALSGRGWGGGVVYGRLLPGNLTVATHLLGTPILPELTGAILAFEDIAETTYRLDRLLTQWRMTGSFQPVAGIALGRFSRCQPPVDSPHWQVEKMLGDRLGDLGIPIVSELPFGHEGANAMLPVGAMVTLDGDRGLLQWEKNLVDTPP